MAARGYELHVLVLKVSLTRIFCSLQCETYVAHPPVTNLRIKVSSKHLQVLLYLERS